MTKPPRPLERFARLADAALWTGTTLLGLYLTIWAIWQATLGHIQAVLDLILTGAIWAGIFGLTITLIRAALIWRAKRRHPNPLLPPPMVGATDPNPDTPWNRMRRLLRSINHEHLYDQPPYIPPPGRTLVCNQEHKDHTPDCYYP